MESLDQQDMIKYWEVRLSDSLQAVRVAQLRLETLYRERYTVGAVIVEQEVEVTEAV